MQPEKLHHTFNWKIAAIIALAAVMIILIYYYRHQVLGIRVPTSSRPVRHKLPEDLQKLNYARVRLTLATGGRTGLAITVGIPYEEASQRSQIYQNQVRIENDLIMKVEQQRLLQLAIEKEYAILRKILLDIINPYLDKPVTDIYFEDFFIIG